MLRHTLHPYIHTYHTITLLTKSHPTHKYSSPLGLRALTLRLLFRPDQEDVDAQVTGEGLAQAFTVYDIYRLWGVCLCHDVCRGAGSLTHPSIVPRTLPQEGRLRRLESLALLPDELRFGEGNEEEGVAVADMVWVATDAFR